MYQILLKTLQNIIANLTNLKYFNKIFISVFVMVYIHSMYVSIAKMEDGELCAKIDLIFSSKISLPLLNFCLKKSLHSFCCYVYLSTQALFLIFHVNHISTLFLNCSMRTLIFSYILINSNYS